MPPTRIMVTGNAGSGKSTLAHTIGAEFGLPVFSLDVIVWTSGWRKRPLSEKNAAIEALIQQPAWIIEGVSEAVEEMAEVVVFLDVRPALCVWRCARRNLRYLLRSRPGLPEGCPEWRIIARLVRLIRSFHHQVRPAIHGRMTCSSRYVHVSGRRDDDSLLSLLRQSYLG